MMIKFAKDHVDIDLYRLIYENKVRILLEFHPCHHIFWVPFSPSEKIILALTQQTTAIYFKFMHGHYLNNVLQTCSTIKKIKSIIVLKMLCSWLMGIYLKPRGQFLSISSDFKEVCEITFFNRFEMKTFPT